MILPRQDQNEPSSSSPLPTTTTHRSDPQNPTILPPAPYAPKLALETWQIVLIVIGSLLFLAVLGTLFICIRTRLALRRGASTTRFENAIGSSTVEFSTETETSDARRGSNARSVNGGGGGGGRGVSVKRERRDSVIDDAKVQIRRLIKKSRPRARSTSYPSTPTSPYKGGVDFGLSALRFGGGGGGGGEKVANGTGKGKKGRRKSQNGVDMRIRSADDHADDEDAYRGNGRVPFMQNDNATGSGSGSGFAAGSARSGTRLMGVAAVTTSPRTDNDIFVTEARPGRGRDSEDWGYGVDSIAHTVRGSFEDAEEQERQRAVAHQHHQLSAAVERLAAESTSWPGHDRGTLR